MLKLLKERAGGILANHSDDSIKEKNDAKSKSLKITVIYFFIGCIWIIFSDILVQSLFPDHSYEVEIYSIIKGTFYVLVTSVIIFLLIYRPMKNMFDAKNEIKAANTELEKSNILFRELSQEFERKQVLLKSLINSIPDLIFYKDTDSAYLGCNEAFEAFVGKPEREIVGKTDFDLFFREEAQMFRNMDIEMMKTHIPRKNEEIVLYPDGSQVYLETLKTPYYDFPHNIIGLIGISRDITERKKREEEIEYLSYHDVLTGLYNRTFYSEQRKRLDTNEFYPLSVISGDVNGLKLINDAFGHTEGDKVLTEIANILKKYIKSGDITARVGGDEFSILLPNTSAQTVRSIADSIRLECVRRRNQKNMFYLDIALGYATKEHEGESFDETMILAEDLMYRHKLLEHKSLHSSIISSIKTTMYEKSNETEEHAERLTELSKKLGRALGLCEDKIDELELVSTLHDIGKISVDRNVLTKAGKLSEEYWREIKKHPDVGYRIANSTPELRHIADYILCHHERWDGKGYPQGLAGKEIPLVSRIISIVDAYDAMTQDRAYRKALPKEEAVAEIMNNAGTQFDPEIAKIFIDKVITSSDKENE